MIIVFSVGHTKLNSRFYSHILNHQGENKQSIHLTELTIINKLPLIYSKAKTIFNFKCSKKQPRNQWLFCFKFELKIELFIFILFLLFRFKNKSKNK